MRWVTLCIVGGVRRRSFLSLGALCTMMFSHLHLSLFIVSLCSLNVNVSGMVSDCTVTCFFVCKQFVEICGCCHNYGFATMYSLGWWCASFRLAMSCYLSISISIDYNVCRMCTSCTFWSVLRIQQFVHYYRVCAGLAEGRMVFKNRRAWSISEAVRAWSHCSSLPMVSAMVLIARSEARVSRNARRNRRASIS